LLIAERALFTKRRKEAYEALHPETRNGAKNEREELRQLGEVKAERFTSDTAKKTGQSERKVQRDASRGETSQPHLLRQN
jgi:ParB family transcriptional regulator, chromosome partitioning protein